MCGRIIIQNPDRRESPEGHFPRGGCKERGTALRGIGSPHTPRDYVWDISLAIQGLTSTDMEMMAENDNGTNMMHEGINVNDPSKYTRPWFSWANSMFCELVLDVCDL